ncbi:MAG: thioredoxin family protein [Deltaproteobacteria bacterium]|nr:thioredoxin family protein [Deltaproteobacteria bacterium]
MAATPSTMLALGTPCPEFRLPDPSGKLFGRDDFAAAPALLVMFICNHCPYVKHIRSALAAFGRDYESRLAMVAISANDAGAYPEDSPARMAEESRSAGYVFPYLFDETQAVAKAFRAACTPEFYLFDNSRELVYRGQFDASRPGSGKAVTGADLRAAVDAVLAGKATCADQRPSIGCNIKWKPKNAPDYFG